MKMIAVTVFASLVLLSGCEKGGSSYKNSYPGPVDHSRSESEIKEDLETREQRNPTSYLDFDGTYRKNIIGELVIEGKISSSATIAKFKDVVLEIDGYSKTKTLIKTWRHTVYEVFSPGRSRAVKVKILVPRSVKSARVDIYNALAF